MQQNEQDDLIIKGFASSIGGFYKDVVINGHGTISSALTCQSFRCNGISKVSGDFTAHEATIKGQLTTLGDIFSEVFHITGKSDIHGSLTTKHIEIEGDFAAKSNGHAETLISKGRMRLNDLEARNIEWKLIGHSKCQQIIGENINIQKGHKNINLLNHDINPFNSQLTTELIQGHDIYIEHANVEVVRGYRVTIGPGCTINKLEYKETFEEIGDSTIHMIKKL